MQEWVQKLQSEFAAFPISPDQTTAWQRLCGWLHDAACRIDGSYHGLACFFEFSPPLISQRSDLLIVSEDEVLVIEAKTGISHNRQQAQKQALEYAYDIYNCLSSNRDRKIIPMVLQESTIRSAPQPLRHLIDQNFTSKSVAVRSVGELVDCISGLTAPSGTQNLLDTSDWLYRPRASVVTLSREMFGNLRDSEVLKSLADGPEITRLITKVREIINETRAKSEHRVIAITGRPGSGKTLVGLRIAHQSSVPDLIGPDEDPPIYLSGNGPLVEVLQEAIARAYKTTHDRYTNETIPKEAARRIAKSHILEVRAMLAEEFRIKTNVIIFDEAQRAWTAQHMRRKKNDQTLESQPFEILKKMSAQQWAVVICLVGTGQHINMGEEGMETWYKAVTEIRERPVRLQQPEARWRISVTRNEKPIHESIVETADLELTVDMRAGSTRLNEWVNLLLDSEIEQARQCRDTFPDFPLKVSRDLDMTVRWLKEHTNIHRGETAGLVASSGSGRLTSYGVRVASAATDNFPAINWYLDRPPNLDSSSSFDFAATEYRCQGLELDRVGVCWSWDLFPMNETWTPRQLNRSSGKWNKIQNLKKKEYAVNSYRVLLTRSRIGMVIWIPPGAPNDLSRSTSEADKIHETLLAAGCDSVLHA